MASILLRRQSKETRRAMTRPGVADGRCKRHPKHSQSPGVCSLCLRERLAQLNNSSAASSRRAAADGSSGGTSSASSLSSYYSSSSGSSCSSPVPRRYNYSNSYRISMSSLLFGSNNVNVLKKSRSLAFVPSSMRTVRANHNGDDDVKNNNHGKRKSNAGFWSKLLHVNHKRTERENHVSLVMHSRTVRERSSVPERLVR